MLKMKFCENKMPEEHEINILNCDRTGMELFSKLTQTHTNRKQNANQTCKQTNERIDGLTITLESVKQWDQVKPSHRILWTEYILCK